MRRSPATMACLRWSKIERKRATSSLASVSAASAAHWMNSLVEMKKLPDAVWSTRMNSLGAMT